MVCKRSATWTWWLILNDVWFTETIDFFLCLPHVFCRLKLELLFSLFFGRSKSNTS
jgi:hypothetical protein